MTADPAADLPYRPRRPAASRHLRLRDLDVHLRLWGALDAPPVLLLHGGLDASATFQFLVDALPDEVVAAWRFVAPDWRGHGRSGWVGAGEGYWFQDYLADLDALVEALAPGGEAVTLVGHSLGGNVACTYAGVRPERVSRLVSLDGFGLPDADPATAPARLARWLDGHRAGARAPTPYATLDAMAERLMAANPRLARDNALFLAAEVSRPDPAGEGHLWAFDPRHRLPFATLHRKAEWAACLRAITAPTLWLGSGAPFPRALAAEEGGLGARLALLRDGRFRAFPGTGHNLHHDAPEAIAAAIAAFLTGFEPA